MARHVKKIKIEWGHCDPAQIVYNPNFYDWMDQGTYGLFFQAGYDFSVLLEKDPAFRGVPLLKNEAVFKEPAIFGDEIELISEVSEWGTKSFTVSHRFMKEGREIIAATEVRVWGMNPDGQRLRAMPVPEEVKAAVSA